MENNVSANLDSTDSLRIELRETEPLLPGPATGPLDSVRVVLEAESRQRDRAAGLLVAIELTNTGSAAVRLQQPDDAMQLEILDQLGRPLDVPRPPPAALVNTRAKPGPHPNAPTMLSLNSAAHYRTSLAVREIRQSSSLVPLMPGTYRIRVKVLLLAADSNLPHEKSFRILQSDQFSIRFGQ